MSAHHQTVKTIHFMRQHIVDLSLLQKHHHSGFDEATWQAVIDEYDRFTQHKVMPLRRYADQHPSHLSAQGVKLPEGYKEAFREFFQAGWQGLRHPSAHGGQDAPLLLASICQELLNSADMAFALCPMLTDSAIEALRLAGTPLQQQLYMRAFIDGKFTGTMNLTEPQAGSDLSQIKTIAEPDTDGTYRLRGQKIFISYGDHTCTDNIIHFVLARTPNAPEGVKGISLFLVPKIMVNHDGSLGTVNDVTCVSVEHKLGLHGSPTCVMQYGQDTGALGYLVGELNQGLRYMFIMMNAARFAVGVQGLGIAQAALEQGLTYAENRIQGRVTNSLNKQPVAINQHADVKRMLLMMQSNVLAARALVYQVAADHDWQGVSADAQALLHHEIDHDLCVSLVKAFCTELAFETCHLNIQVHGGAGYIEETGAAQLFRDVRVLSIYEGTNAIQANDFVRRKILSDRGVRLRRYLDSLELFVKNQVSLDVLHQVMPIAVKALEDSVVLFKQSIDKILDYDDTNQDAAIDQVAFAFLMQAGYTMSGLLLVRLLSTSVKQHQMVFNETEYNDCIQKPIQFFLCQALSKNMMYHSQIGLSLGSM